MYMTLLVPEVFMQAQRFILSYMVIDKETKMKETLKIMSMKTVSYSMSYIIS